MTTPWVWITRELDRGQRFADQISASGITPIQIPTIQCIPLPLSSEIHQALNAAYDWIVFTSVNGVRFYAENVKKDPFLYANTHIAGIGPATTLEIESLLGVTPKTLEPVSTGDELAALLCRMGISGKKVLLPGPVKRQGSLGTLLREAGAEVREVSLYETVSRALSDGEKARLETMNPELGIVTFFSPSAVAGLFAALPETWLRTRSIAAFGPSTAKALGERGLIPTLQASGKEGLPSEQEFFNSIACFLRTL